MKDYVGFWRIICIVAQELLFYLQKLFVKGKLLKASKLYVISEYSIPFLPYDKKNIFVLRHAKNVCQINSEDR